MRVEAFVSRGCEVYVSIFGVQPFALCYFAIKRFMLILDGYFLAILPLLAFCFSAIPVFVL